MPKAQQFWAFRTSLRLPVWEPNPANRVASTAVFVLCSRLPFPSCDAQGIAQAWAASTSDLSAASPVTAIGCAPVARRVGMSSCSMLCRSPRHAMREAGRGISTRSPSGCGAAAVGTAWQSAGRGEGSRARIGSIWGCWAAPRVQAIPVAVSCAVGGGSRLRSDRSDW